MKKSISLSALAATTLAIFCLAITNQASAQIVNFDTPNFIEELKQSGLVTTIKATATKIKETNKQIHGAIEDRKGLQRVLATVGSIASGNAMVDLANCLPRININGNLNINFDKLLSGNTTLYCSEPGKLRLQQNYFYNAGCVNGSATATVDGKGLNESGGGCAGSGSGTLDTPIGKQSGMFYGPLTELDRKSIAHLRSLPDDPKMQMASCENCGEQSLWIHQVANFGLARRSVEEYQDALRKERAKALADSNRELYGASGEIAANATHALKSTADIVDSLEETNALTNLQYNLVLTESIANTTLAQKQIADSHLLRFEAMQYINNEAPLFIASNLQPVTAAEYLQKIYAHDPRLFIEFPDLLIESPYILVHNPNILDNEPIAKKKMAIYLDDYPEKKIMLAEAWRNAPELHTLFAEIVPPETPEKKFADRAKKIFSMLLK